MLQSISKITALLITVFISGYIATGLVYSAVMADFKVEPDTVLYPGDIEVKPVPEDTFQTDQYKLYTVKNVQEQ